uniref:Uncharacterized protein n=1 Tax=Brassica oleracea var. oleracea TaxID=109376 RepID=A0A0D3E7T9_BRAOL
MFGEPSSRLDPSSSALDSSGPETVPETQYSPRVSRSPPFEVPPPVPPPMAPPMPAGIHPDLMVPPSAPYSQYTVEFGVDGCVAQNVTETIKGYFSEPHPNWKKTPIYVRKTWFKIFAHWSMGVNEKVKKAFNAKAKVRLLDTVSNWKGDWIVKGYERGKLLSSPRMCGMASSVIGGILTPLESPNLAQPPIRR